MARESGETILQEAGIFITPVDSREIISQSPKPHQSQEMSYIPPRWFM
jgi:hypothetical protein